MVDGRVDIHESFAGRIAAGGPVPVLRSACKWGAVWGGSYLVIVVLSAIPKGQINWSLLPVIAASLFIIWALVYIGADLAGRDLIVDRAGVVLVDHLTGRRAWAMDAVRSVRLTFVAPQYVTISFDVGDPRAETVTVTCKYDASTMSELTSCLASKGIEVKSEGGPFRDYRRE